MSDSDMTDLDVTGLDETVWATLRAEARVMTAHSYAPYSNVHVGAAALVDDGRIVHGCNVENASLGLGTCAENGIASDLAATGGGRLVALAVVAGDGEPIAPCGRCRQVLYEFGGADLLIDRPGGPAPLSALLPEAFGPADLPTRADRPADRPAAPPEKA